MIWERTKEIHTALLRFGDTIHIFLESPCTFYTPQGLEKHFLQRMGHVIQVQTDRLIWADKRSGALDPDLLWIFQRAIADSCSPASPSSELN